MNSTNSTLLDYQKDEINLYYVICEVLVAVFAVIGNALVIFVFRKERRLRRRTNYYIVSLAAADLLVGLLGIPFAIMSSVGLPTNLHACLFTVSLLVVLCTISIFCLVAVSVDRYWAMIITVCWVAGTIVGFLPLMGWHKSAPSDGRCFFLGVMDYNYLVFLYFGTIITPALLLAAFYAHIYQVVLKQLRQIVTMNPENGSSSTSCSSGGTMLRMLGAAQKREVKATQNLAIIVLFFMICWIPLYTINCILAFCNDCKVDSTFMFSCIILSHLNSAGNPLLYAYHLRDFRAALKNFFCNLFGYSEAQVVPSHKRTSYNNYTNCRTDRLCNRSHNHSQIYYRKKSIDQVLTIVAATAGEPPNREMWNIPEASSNSSDSLKHHNEKISIVRPETPYCVKPNSLVNQGYVETSSLDDDDVFIDETFPFNEFNYDELDTNLTEKLKREVQVKTLSNSSPQLSRNLFLVEDNCKTQFMRSCSLVENELKANRITSPFREMFKKKPKLGRSLSDEGTTSNESIQRKPNGNVIRSSCGS
ncbi:uncharacterized LOC103314255 [Tribolium castaneum]|uniref:Neuropeptide receptor n=1 Tax=Tribolium castaneum TaxID=7070 RepID=A0A0I9QQN8_TRICA|nr:uncharacterized LOC103314255 [Tribolium castaneum]DAA64800.1 TPA_exp: neuropeptide receptor [Tribolium castaneum]